jgi:hypothetical protein
MIPCSYLHGHLYSKKPIEEAQVENFNNKLAKALSSVAPIDKSDMKIITLCLEKLKESSDERLKQKQLLSIANVAKTNLNVLLFENNCRFLHSILFSISVEVYPEFKPLVDKLVMQGNLKIGSLGLRDLNFLLKFFKSFEEAVGSRRIDDFENLFKLTQLVEAAIINFISRLPHVKRQLSINKIKALIKESFGFTDPKVKIHYTNLVISLLKIVNEEKLKFLWNEEMDNVSLLVSQAQSSPELTKLMASLKSSNENKQVLEHKDSSHPETLYLESPL